MADTYFSIRNRADPINTTQSQQQQHIEVVHHHEVDDQQQKIPAQNILYEQPNLGAC